MLNIRKSACGKRHNLLGMYVKCTSLDEGRSTSEGLLARYSTQKMGRRNEALRITRQTGVSDGNPVLQMGKRLWSRMAGDISKPFEKKSLLKDIESRIRVGGPMTLADYMKTVLTCPSSGYYMSKDVFGSDGDFTTSPEICQIFGELIGIWCLDQWYKMGQPTPFQIVELGPGRGTMMSDILRVLKRVKGIGEIATVHLVEISPTMRTLQEKNLCSPIRREKNDDNKPQIDDSQATIRRTTTGVPIFWHSDISDVPKAFSIFLAHEFFDALPIHKFQKTDGGWREVLIDIEEGSTNSKLRFVLTRKPTPASTVFIKADETRNHVEVCPQGRILVENLANRVVENGGVVLVVDYGHNGEGGDTFRAFQNHKQVDPLVEPGTADLTADVDFGEMRNVLAQNKDVVTYGPVTQSTFLRNLGIEIRLQQLLANCTASTGEALTSGCAQLLDADKMGTRFKCFAIYPEVMKPVFERLPPSGFFPQT